MATIHTTLSRAFSTNFMLYFQAHVAHVNLRGDDFLQYHEFLGEIYEDAQENIDTYAEFMRILERDMPCSLTKIVANSEIGDSCPSSAEFFSDYSAIFKYIYDNIEVLIDVLKKLYVAAEEAEDYGLSGYVQERLVVHKKQCWKLKMLMKEESDE